MTTPQPKIVNCSLNAYKDIQRGIDLRAAAYPQEVQYLRAFMNGGFIDTRPTTQGRFNYTENGRVPSLAFFDMLLRAHKRGRLALSLPLLRFEFGKNGLAFETDPERDVGCGHKVPATASKYRITPETRARALQLQGEIVDRLLAKCPGFFAGNYVVDEGRKPREAEVAVPAEALAF